MEKQKIKEQIYKEKLRLLCKNTIVALFSTIVGAAALVFLLRKTTDFNSACIWFIIVILLSLVEFLLSRNFLKKRFKKSSYKEQVKMVRIISALRIFSGITIGLSLLIFGSIESQVMVYHLPYILAIHLIGGLAAYGVMAGIFYLYSIPVAISFVINYFYYGSKGNAIPLTVGAMAIVSYMGLLMFARIIYQIILSSIKLVVEKQTLITTIEDEVIDQKILHLELLEKEETLRSMFDSALDGIVVIDPVDKKFFMVNETFYKMLGYTYEEILSLTVSSIESDKNLSFFTDVNYEKLMFDKNYSKKNISLLKKNGSSLYTDVSARRVELNQKEYLMVAFHDITLRKEVEEEIRHKKERLDLAITGAELGVWDWNIQTGYISFNSKWRKILGYSEEEVTPHVSFREELIHPEDREEVNRILKLHLSGEIPYYESEHRMLTKDGEWKWVLDRGSICQWDNMEKPQRAIGILRDITKQKEYEENLQNLSLHDSLTGLPNRRNFEKVFESEWKRSMREKKTLSIIMIDIDFFKFYNDRYGHQAGDKCLIRVANCLQEEGKRAGDLVGRYGGEEFIVILPDTEMKGAMAMAELMRKRVLKEKISHEKSKVNSYVTISLGVATVSPQAGMEPVSLIKEADDALYKSKSNGRNRATTGS